MKGEARKRRLEALRAKFAQPPGPAPWQRDGVPGRFVCAACKGDGCRRCKFDGYGWRQ